MPAKELNSRNVYVKRWFWNINRAAMLEKLLKNYWAPRTCSGVTLPAQLLFLLNTQQLLCFSIVAHELSVTEDLFHYSFRITAQSRKLAATSEVV
jgi:hypothetical protein